MIIKKFQGKTEAEAVEAAKKELGSNVVVMNVRSVKPSGVLSFLKPQMTEVTVALEAENVPSPQVIKREEIKSRPVSPAPGGEAVQAPAKEGARTDNNAIEEKLNSLQFLIEKQLQKPEEEEEEFPDEPDDEMERFMKLLYNTMLKNEVDEKYANQIIDEIDKLNKPGMPFDYALANVYQRMVLKFGKPRQIEPCEKGPKVIFFVGPTGVGKTTTIAKIASEFSVEEGRKVALLTADTYRIAAAEQLRTYADILEVPFRVIYTPQEVEQSLKDFSDCDFILVDTMGHSYQNEEQKQAMKGSLHSVDDIAPKEVFLVLSAATKYKDLVNIVDAYSAITEYKLIFTKVDETTTLGNILNIKLYTGADLSYITFGQNVPSDIESFDPQRTAKLLLGGRRKKDRGTTDK